MGGRKLLLVPGTGLSLRNPEIDLHPDFDSLSRLSQGEQDNSPEALCNASSTYKFFASLHLTFLFLLSRNVNVIEICLFLGLLLCGLNFDYFPIGHPFPLVHY